VPEEEKKAVGGFKKFLQRSKRRFKSGWRIYKESRVGKLGLGIMTGFFILAIFADFIAPYSPNFVAPDEDVFKADSVTQSLPQHHTEDTWQTPVGHYGEDESLESILVYSLEGHAVRYKVEKVDKGNRSVGMLLKDPVQYRVPENISYFRSVDFRQYLYLAVAQDTIYELNYHTLSVLKKILIGFEPKYYSNFWNRWSLVNTEGRLYLVMANESMISLYARVPPNQKIGEIADRTFVSTVNLDNISSLKGQRVLGDILFLDRPDMKNGTMIIAPLTHSLAALRVDINQSSLGTVKNIEIGEVVWQVNYTEIEAGPERNPYPIEKRPISFYKEDPSETFGKDRILFLSTDGYLYSFYTENGTLAWSTVLSSSKLKEPLFRGVYATYRGLALIVGESQGRGFVASVEPSTGVIERNGSAVYTFDGFVASTPEYVPSSRHYIFNTDNGIVHILKETMELYATFAIKPGFESPVTYVGNIFNRVGSYQGNYFALVKSDNTLYVKSLTGTYIAPLKPGVYPSGNRYLLGTDVFGHDVFSQFVYATRIELVVGILAALIAVGLGTAVGLISGYYGGWVDSLLMRLTDIFLTLPVLVIILLMAAILGGSIRNIIIIIAIFSWSGIARVIRAQTLSLKTRSFVDAARVSGASNTKIILVHLAPNVLPFTFLYMTFTISGAIITEAILAFLGFGDPTVITWGMMLQYLRISGNTLTAPWWLLPPGIGITLLSLAFYLIGRALDEVVNPRLRSR